MKASTKKFVAKLLVLCMMIGLVPVAELALNTDIATLSSSAESYYTNDSDSVSKPATSGSETKVEVAVSGGVATDGTTTVTVTDAAMAEAVDTAIKSATADKTAPVVEVKLNAKTASGFSVTLPKAPVETLGKAADAVLRIVCNKTSIEFDTTSIATIAGAAISKQDITISAGPIKAGRLLYAQRELVGNHQIFDFSIKSGTKDITDFGGGKAKIALPYTLPEGIEGSAVKVYYMDDVPTLTGMETTYDADAGVVSFTTPHFSIYVVGEEGMAGEPTGITFTDLVANAWYQAAVEFCAENGYMTGTAADKFEPETTVTRGMFAMIVYKLEGQPAATAAGDFTDVPEDQYYAKAVNWAAKNGIVEGKGNGIYDPNAPVTRNEMVTMIARYAKLKGVDTSATADLSAYTDAAQIPEFASAAFGWAVNAGVIKGTSDTTLEPNGPSTRAQIAQVIMNYMGK